MKTIASLITAFIVTFSAPGFTSGGQGTSADNEYNLGKKTFRHKLYCQSCPLGKKPLDKEGIATILKSLSEKGEVADSLNEKERAAVIHFLKQRYERL